VRGKYIQTENAKLFIPDAMLLDQNGKKVQFYTDLVKGKVVVISLFYSTCAYVCKAQGDTFSRLQALLGNRLGKDVFLIPISFDPITDTPDRLKTYAAAFGAKPGWSFVTGEETGINGFLKAFVGAVPSAGMHSSTILAGNEQSGVWTVADGLWPPEVLMNLIERVAVVKLER
jgi:protein SCO1/2